MKPMKPWKTLTRRVILNTGKFLTVEMHAVQLPDGRVIEDWPWIITPDYVNVVAITAEGTFICFRQTKYAVAGTTLALAGGYLEPGEAPLAAAQRELREETGYAAPEWVDLGHYALGGNRGVATAHLYLARGARRIAEIDADDLEEQELLLLSREEVAEALKAGAFKVLPWAAAVALAFRHMEEQDAG